MSENRHDRPHASGNPGTPTPGRAGTSARPSANAAHGTSAQRSANPAHGTSARSGANAVHGTSARRSANPARGTSVRPGANAARRSVHGASAQRRSAGAARGQGRKRANGLLTALGAVAAAFAVLFGGIRRAFSAVNHKLDFLRKGEVRTVVVNAALGCALLFVALCILMACRPAIDSARARSSANSGHVETALRIVHGMENRGCSEARMNQTRMSVAEGFIRAGEYAAARSMLADVAQNDDATALLNRANYAEAESLFALGDYSGAGQMFYTLSGYADSAARYADCRCALAIQAWQEGRESSARSLLLDVPDAAEHVAAVVDAVAGADAPAVLAADLFQPENLAHLEETMAGLLSARETMPRGKIAAGKFHTVGVKSDGTVLAAGDNRFGQSEVSAWTNVTQVAAGTIHTVGLRADGTVVACGDDTYGQCDVSGWTDVVAIAAASFDTIGLKSDGSVVAAGLHADKVAGWHGATFVTGGSYSLACLYDKGTMLSSHGGAQLDMDAVLYDLSVCGPVSAGVLYDGAMISSLDSAPDWTEMVSVVATETGILGIDVSGSVRTYFYRPGDAVGISLSEFAVEIASSGTHHVVLTETGAVHAYGSNDFGQCDVGGWVL